MGDSGTPTASTAIDTLDPDSWGCQTLPHGFARNESMFPAIRLGYIWDPKSAIGIPGWAHIRPGQACFRRCTQRWVRLRIHPLTSCASHTTIIFWDPKSGGPAD